MKLAALALWLLTLCWPAVADEAALRALVAQSGLPRDSLSLLAVEQAPGGPRAVLAVNADQPLIPASVTKLVTAAAVLREIPLGTRFETRLVSAAPLRRGLGAGGLVMAGRGEGPLASASGGGLRNGRAGGGVGAVGGDILGDASDFEAELRGPGRDTRPSAVAYEAPLGDLSFTWDA